MYQPLMAFLNSSVPVQGKFAKSPDTSYFPKNGSNFCSSVLSSPGWLPIFRQVPWGCQSGGKPSRSRSRAGGHHFATSALRDHPTTAWELAESLRKRAAKDVNTDRQSGITGA